MELKTAVLIVEDQAGAARLIQEWLADRGGYETTHVTALREALRALDRQVFDVVLLDLNLPDSKGLDTLRALREQQRYVPVVVVSGMESPDVALGAISEGAQSYLLKQKFNAYWTDHVIREAIERCRLQMALDAKATYELRAHRGFAAVCAGCRRVRDEATRGWLQADEYLERHGVDVSHSMCPECQARALDEIENDFFGFWIGGVIQEIVSRYRLQMALDAKTAYALRAHLGFVAVCVGCRRARDEATREWLQVDEWLERHGVDVSHSMCPECQARVLCQIEDEEADDGDT